MALKVLFAPADSYARIWRLQGRNLMWAVLKKTLEEFQKDECPRMAAALAFYTVFSLPAIVVAIVFVVGVLVEPLASEEGTDGKRPTVKINLY